MLHAVCSLQLQFGADNSSLAISVAPAAFSPGYSNDFGTYCFLLYRHVIGESLKLSSPFSDHVLFVFHAADVISPTCTVYRRPEQATLRWPASHLLMVQRRPPISLCRLLHPRHTLLSRRLSVLVWTEVILW